MLFLAPGPPFQFPLVLIGRKLFRQLSYLLQFFLSSLDVIQSLGYPQMTPVVPRPIGLDYTLILNNKGVVVEAVTRPGDFLAFFIPIIEHLIEGDKAETR